MVAYKFRTTTRLILKNNYYQNLFCPTYCYRLLHLTVDGCTHHVFVAHAPIAVIGSAGGGVTS